MDIWQFATNQEGLPKAPEGFTEGSPRAISLGYFDGVHAGHRIILEKLIYEAQKRSLPPVVHTFSDTPISKLVSGEDTHRGDLTTLKERCYFFSRVGAAETTLFPFNDRIAHMEPEDFFHKYLVEKLGAKVLIAGDDYRFGRGQSGDMKLLKSLCDPLGIEVFSVKPLCFEGRKVSSGWIRDLVSAGDIRTANRLLGYPISYQGVVEEGKKLGRTLGFPTANVRITDGKIIPRYGVYASLLSTDSGTFPSVTSIGLRPTVNSTDPNPLSETTIIDCDTNLYGKNIRVHLLHFLRPEFKFPNVEALRDQVNRDMAEVRHYHEHHAADYTIMLPGVL